MNWRTPDWIISLVVTHDGRAGQAAIDEYRRRIALKHGDCLCDEILKPSEYIRYPFGVDGPSLNEAKIKELEREIDDIEDEIAGLQSDLRDKQAELTELRRGVQPTRFY